jgi:hypothetical protein
VAIWSQALNVVRPLSDRFDRGIELADIEQLVWNFNLEVPLTLLASHPVSLLALLGIEVGLLSRKQRSRTRFDNHFAQATGRFAAAGRGDENFLCASVFKRVEPPSTLRIFWPVVDIDLAFAVVVEKMLCRMMTRARTPDIALTLRMVVKIAMGCHLLSDAAFCWPSSDVARVVVRRW